MPSTHSFFDDVSDIAATYNSDPQGEQTRLDRHQLEYDLTWRYFDHYLPKSGTVLEIGAATGRYTLELARRGYKVTAVDMSSNLLDENRRIIASANLDKQVHYILADARDLSKIKETQYDVVLLMGPLYHLIYEEDRKSVINEVYEHLRMNGILLSAFISRLGIMGDLIKNVTNWVEDQNAVDLYLKEGRDSEDYHAGRFRGYFASVDEIVPLHEKAGFETLAVAGVEPAISSDDESYNQLQGNLRALWLDLLFKISAEKSIIGASRHLLYVGRKVR